jgi:class 3 adenylate cyclase
LELQDVTKNDAVNAPLRRRVGWRSFKPSIAVVLAVAFSVLVILAGGTILRFSLWTGVRSTQDLIADKVVLILGAVTNRLTEHLNPARQIVGNLASLAAKGIVDPAVPAVLGSALSAARSGSPQVRSVLFIDRNGKSTGFHGATDEGPLLTEDWSGEPEVRKRLASLERLRVTTWGPAVYLADLDLTVLNASAPVFRDREFLGAFVATVSVDELSRHLASLPASAGEVPFVLSGRQTVVAHPSLATHQSSRDDHEPLLPRSQSSDPVLRRMWDPEFIRESRGVSLPPGYELQVVMLPPVAGGGEYVVAYRREPGFGSSDWIVGVHFPLERIGGPLQSVIKAGIAAVGVLVLGVAVAVLLALSITRPWRQLQLAASQLRDQGSEAVAALPPSRLKEVNAANVAFNGMVEGMRERELIRDLFGRFVPEEVAHTLVADRGNLAPQTREATVLFSDIAGFSTLAEGLEPEALIRLLNEYFELLGDIIRRHNGVIQQFQGDAILATFNLPVQDADHAADAVRCAIEIQYALQQRRFGDGHELITRIGINSGTMVGGTVGSESRKGYTVHGDAVNLAARLESLNKAHGTSILVAESTAELAGDGFDFRPIGEVSIRGRQRAARLYTVAVA